MRIEVNTHFDSWSANDRLFIENSFIRVAEFYDVPLSTLWIMEQENMWMWDEQY